MACHSLGRKYKTGWVYYIIISYMNEMLPRCQWTVTKLNKVWWRSSSSREVLSLLRKVTIACRARHQKEEGSLPCKRTGGHLVREALHPHLHADCQSLPLMCWAHHTSSWHLNMQLCLVGTSPLAATRYHIPQSNNHDLHCWFDMPSW